MLDEVARGWRELTLCAARFVFSHFAWHIVE